MLQNLTIKGVFDFDQTYLIKISHCSHINCSIRCLYLYLCIRSAMEKSNSFRFSAEQLKKINHLLPKGYKFVARQEIIKKDVSKPYKKKVVPPPLPPVGVITSQSKPKIQKNIQEEYQPKVKVFLPQIYVSPNDPPAGTSLKLFQKIKKHPAFPSLSRVTKQKQTDITLKEIEAKTIANGESYKLVDLEGDIQKFCLMIYKGFAKANNQYQQAADLENYLSSLMKIERNHEAKKQPEPLTLQRSNSLQPTTLNRKKTVPINRSLYQPIAQSRLPTPSQKRMLGQMIKKLPSESLQQVCYIVFESTENRDYVFDLDTLHVKKFRELQQYVKKFMEKSLQWEMRNDEDEDFSNESFFVIEDDD